MAGLGFSKSNVHAVIVDLEERVWIARDYGGYIILLTPRPNWRNRHGIALGYSIAPEQTPGEYMRQCRVAAGKSIAECAAQIAVIHADNVRAAEDLAALESNQPGDYNRLIRQLKERAAFPFDFATFASLAAATCDSSLDELETA